MPVTFPLGSPRTGQAGLDPIAVEILAEKAAALGRAGERMAAALSRLREHGGEAAQRRQMVRDAAEAVYNYFIQREVCGFRRHDDIIREFAIPREVLVRLGASETSHPDPPSPPRDNLP